MNRKVDKVVNRREYITVCKIWDAGQDMCGGTQALKVLFLYMWERNNAENEASSAIVGKYRRSAKTTKEARI